MKDAKMIKDQMQYLADVISNIEEVYFDEPADLMAAYERNKAYLSVAYAGEFDAFLASESATL